MNPAESSADRYDDDYKDTSETNARLTSAKIDNPAGSFGSDGRVADTSDDPRHRARNQYTQQIFSLFDGYGKNVHMVDFDKSCHPSDYRTVLEPNRVFVIWRAPYLGAQKVCELPIENGASEELQRIFNHEPLRKYIYNVCIRRTHPLLYFKEHGHRVFQFDELNCIVWQKLDKIIRPGAAFNFYKIAIKNTLMDAYRDGGRAVRVKQRFRDNPGILTRRSVLVKHDRETPREHGDVGWTGT